MKLWAAAYSVTGCEKTGIKVLSTCIKVECNWVINAWIHFHGGSESNLETSGKPHLSNVVKKSISSDVFEVELFLLTSRQSTSNYGGDEVTMVGR